MSLALRLETSSLPRLCNPLPQISSLALCLPQSPDPMQMLCLPLALILALIW